MKKILYVFIILFALYFVSGCCVVSRDTDLELQVDMTALEALNSKDSVICTNSYNIDYSEVKNLKRMEIGSSERVTATNEDKLVIVGNVINYKIALFSPNNNRIIAYYEMFEKNYNTEEVTLGMLNAYKKILEEEKYDDYLDYGILVDNSQISYWYKLEVDNVNMSKDKFANDISKDNYNCVIK